MSKKIRLGLTLGLVLWSLVSIRSISYAQLTNTPWPMFGHDLQHTGRSPYVGPSLPKLKWSCSTGSSIPSSPAIGADGTIYVGSHDKNLYAIAQGELLTITTTSLPNGMQNITYSQTLSATGGMTPYTWSLSTGGLPSGLTLSQTGVISGTPTVTGTFSFTVQVQDSSTPKQIATQALSLTIRPSVLNITTTSLVSGAQNVPYSQILSATGGVLPYTWSILVDSLPPGLSLAPATGVISGTPTTTGTFSFTVQVQDKDTPAQTVTKISPSQ